MSTAKELGLWVCKVHHKNEGVHCMSCHVSIDFNVAHRPCACGNKAVGYRILSADADVEFFCDEHFKGIDEL